MCRSGSDSPFCPHWYQSAAARRIAPPESAKAPAYSSCIHESCKPAAIDMSVTAVVAEMKQETHPKLAVQASSKASPLRWLTSGTPTNWNMLLFRTINRDIGHPNANADHLAPLLRDKLMPVRMWWLKHAPGAMSQFKKGLEHKTLGAPGVCNFVDARTKWFDKIVNVSLTNQGIKQVVCVAAGFDTRAYRFGAKHPDVRFFEVDLPHASKKKQQLVQQLLQPESAYPRPTYLPADLSQVSIDQVLMTAAHITTTTNRPFDLQLPTLFTVEGLIYYLPESAVQQLFAAMLKVAAPGSRVAFDFLHKDVLEGSVPLPPAYKVTAQSVANKNETFISGITNSRNAVQAFVDGISSQTAGLAGSDIAGRGSKGFEVSEYLGPKEMVAQQLPHLKWHDDVPPILSFYSFAALQVV